MNNEIAYKSLTAEELKKGLEQMSSMLTQDRSFTVYTGETGAKQFHHAMEKAWIEEQLKELTSYISLHEFQKLKDMIDSPDHRNFTLAKIIIETKLQQV